MSGYREYHRVFLQDKFFEYHWVRFTTVDHWPKSLQKISNFSALSNLDVGKFSKKKNWDIWVKKVNCDEKHPVVPKNFVLEKHPRVPFYSTW